MNRGVFALLTLFYACSNPHVQAASPQLAPHTLSAVLDGHIPWWHSLPTGAYQLTNHGVFSGDWQLAVGRSSAHHHITEGLLKARMNARISLNKKGAIQHQEPRILDLFITPDNGVYVLYGAPLSASHPGDLSPLAPPVELKGSKELHLIGRHLFKNSRHTYLECDVEGPVTNPDWGSDEVVAQHPHSKKHHQQDQP